MVVKTSVGLVVLAVVLIMSDITGARSVSKQMSGLADTIVNLGAETSAGHRLLKRSPLVQEIMGPLSRNVRQVDEIGRSQMVYSSMRVLLTLLRMRLGKSPQIEILQFNNWDKTIKVDQMFFVKPKTIFEVRKVIFAAKSLGMRVRATGAGHSRSPLYVDEGDIMMDVRELQRHDGPFIELNQENSVRSYKTITAMTSAHMFELNQFMTDNEVTILAEPLNDQETLGGMVAAGSHGSTYNAPAFPGIVVEMRLMDSMGRLRRFTIEKHPELMRALSLNLGTFGIMYDITFRVESAIKVKVENSFVKVGDIMLNKANLKRQVEGNMFGEISWFPFNTITPDEEAEYIRTGKVPDTWNAADDYLWIRTFNPASDDEIGNHPIQGAITLDTKGSLSGGPSVGLLRAKGSLDLARRLPSFSFHYLVNAFPIIEPPRYGSETSAAFLLNIDTDFDRPYRAIKYLVEKTEEQIKRNGSTPMNALLPRFYKNSDCFLCFGNTEISMPGDNGHSVVIDFLAPPSQEGFYPAAADVSRLVS
ncbi:D-arabinono-1,4-lactone oxidase-like [Elysia marginata]|uniref:D-arabinono-1,4-lactone oxidase-like n=1 Tax=Elysia marginata TaxID=1093978 RepID=A0AAV4JMQ7_9GAST|nr:D-arabinono-1,4-lactone oxidase-like [Elysia marginata]